MDARFNPKTALEFLKQLEEQKITIDVCRINKENYLVKAFNIVELNKNSQSDAVLLTADLITDIIKGVLPVVFKIFKNYLQIPPEHKLPTLGLFYEMSVYEYISENIIHTNLCPYFIDFVASGECIDETNPNVEKCFLITEKAGNGTPFGFATSLPVYPLSDKNFIEQLKLENRDDLKTILVQIYYALAVMERFSIVHNDLHTGNILIMKLPMKINICLGYNNKFANFSTRYIPLIFDWDNSYVEELGPNPYLEDQKVFGMYNSYDSRRDLYTFMCYFVNTISRPKWYDYPLIKKQHKNTFIIITEQEAKTILSAKHYMIGKNPVNENQDILVFKLSKAELDSFLTEQNSKDGLELLVADIAGDVYVYILHKQDNNGVDEWQLYLWNPYECRMSNIPERFPTISELCDNIFSSPQPIETRYKFILPVESFQPRQKIQRVEEPSASASASASAPPPPVQLDNSPKRKKRENKEN